MDGFSDEQLILTFQQTEEMRFLDELVHRHMNKVRAMVYPIVLNHTDADEVTQEVFIRMARGARGFTHKSRFSTWLHRITINTSMSFLSRRARRPMDFREEMPDQTDHAPAPDSALSTKERDSEIAAAMASLSPALRAAITLTSIQGMNAREAARAQGCMTATMYWRIHEARKQLQKRLGRYLSQ